MKLWPPTLLFQLPSLDCATADRFARSMLERGKAIMYRDVAQWLRIRDQILRKGVPIRQIVRDIGISRKTVRKMLKYPHPPPFRPRNRGYPKLGPHTSTVQRLVQENATLPPSVRLSARPFTNTYEIPKDFVEAIVQ